MWLFGGGVLSAVMALLLYVLSTGRARTLSVVNQRTAELAHRASHDNLTGLPNRAKVTERAEAMVARGTLAAAMFVDLDGFKQINDGFGHAAGDALLKAVAARLRAAVREADLVARLGGDEFVVLLDSTAGETHPCEIAERMIRAVRNPIRLDEGMIVSVGASVGISMVPRESASEVLHDADLALYAAKEAGRSRYCVYEDGMEEAEQDSREGADKPVAQAEAQPLLAV
jgi:diguanylate cyclase (GGDEF)-like protein